MAMKDIWAKTGSWLRAQKLSKAVDYHPQIDDEGLISPDNETRQSSDDKPPEQDTQVLAKSVPPADKNQSLEKLQDGFNRLIDQLQGINEHLNHQAAQQENLMNQMDKLPRLMESFPAVVDNQKQLTEKLFEQLKATNVKDEQFIDAVEKIPTEVGRQTDALVNIDHQLAAAADADTQMAENFNTFNQTLDKLNLTTGSQTDSIMQMSKTFAASDRYLKYIISRQSKRFMWIFVAAIGVCLFTILVLAGIIIYLRQ